ncbi:toxin-antitoxin system HicB family antitoxin [Azospirillum sp. TSO35-2]|uniref:toxin-antitoxin system HicB family antitoxin n=1 Tax=Azospirillum sp. TSO35-2 TaxID=716796 RepID=UPI000D6441A7|nr:toxin-antitoxin system HicB family antitoxin [Azospirillum sp. TSO35-2]
MAKVSLKQYEIEAIKYAADLVRTAAEGANQHVYNQMPLAALCVPVAFDYRWRPVANDPDDDHVLETTINGVADMIASFNLTDLTAGERSQEIMMASFLLRIPDDLKDEAARLADAAGVSLNQ